MPKHKGVRIALVSQYDAMLIPEYRSHHVDDHPAATHRVDTYISNYAASQFWIRYACDPTTQEPETRFFYFKLFIAGRPVVAWGCGAQDEWQGQTFFVPSDASSVDDGTMPRKKLGLFFPRNIEIMSEVPALEIQVYRATARRRQERQYASVTVATGGDDRVHLDSIGIVRSREAKRFYSYALSDPKDEPFACFRYYCLAHEELKRRGFVKRSLRVASPIQGFYDESRDRSGWFLDSSSATIEDDHIEEEEKEDYEETSSLLTNFHVPSRLQSKVSSTGKSIVGEEDFGSHQIDDDTDDNE